MVQRVHRPPLFPPQTPLKPSQISFKVHGRVQGVSFRYYTRKKAISYNLTGWVRNAAQGNVEGEAQGEEDGIQKLVKDLGTGPTHAHVERLEKEVIEVKEGEEGFVVRR